MESERGARDEKGKERRGKGKQERQGKKITESLVKKGKRSKRIEEIS